MPDDRRERQTSSFPPTRGFAESQIRHGARRASERKRFASSSPINSCLDVVVIDLPAQEQSNVGCVTSDVRVAGSDRISFRLATRLDAIQEVANVERRGIPSDLGDLATGQQLGRAEYDAAAVASFHPTVFTLEPYRT